ncbi:MAG: hypothetical protein ACK5GN_07945 [Pseudomonadota bacterium]|jgi:hypothetical protein
MQPANETLLDPLARMVLARRVLSAGCPPQSNTVEVDDVTYSARLSNVADGVQLELTRYSASRELTSEVYLINEKEISGTAFVRTWSGTPRMDMETFEQSGPYEDREYFPPARRADQALEEMARWA